MGKEWSLVIFTLLAQASIGLMIVTQVLGTKERSQVKNVLPWIGILMGLSMIASLGHLGSPLGAPKAILNLKSSWLSREIFFSSSFLALWIVSYFIEGKGTISTGMKNLVGWIASLFGALALISMAAIYANTMLPAWGTAYTHLSFYSTALILGALIYAVLVYRAEPQGQEKMLKTISYLMATGIIVQTASLAPYLVSLAGGTVAAQASAKLLIQATPALVLSQALAIIGGIVFVFRFSSLYKEQGSKLPGIRLYGALMLVLLSVITSRYLFYATGVSIMVGQF